MAEVTLAEMVRNGTMSAEVAALLWAAVDARTSFLTVAIPRFAGKSTLSEAVLALRPNEVPLQRVAGRTDEMERLQQERRGGYLVVAEFSQAPVPGYIWGEPVRRVFETLPAGYSLQAALHAPGPVPAIAEVTAGNGVPDGLASAIQLVVYIERFGTDLPNFWRRVAEVYEVDRVESGRPVGRTLFRWRQEGDVFEQLEKPRQFATDVTDLARRATVLGGLAQSGRTSGADVAAAVRAFRAGREPEGGRGSAAAGG